MTIFNSYAKLPEGMSRHSYWKWPFIVDLPSYKLVIFHSYVNVYQRVARDMANWQWIFPVESCFSNSHDRKFQMVSEKRNLSGCENMSNFTSSSSAVFYVTIYIYHGCRPNGLLMTWWQDSVVRCQVVTSIYVTWRLYGYYSRWW